MGENFQKAIDLLRADSIEDTNDVYSQELSREDNVNQAFKYLLDERI